MNFFNLNYFIHVANIVLLVAYSVQDILWLRLFAVASSLIAIPYFLFQPTPLWAPLSWTLLFTTVNAYKSWRLFLERRPVKLTADEEEVRRLALGNLSSREVLRVLSIASWTTAERGDRLIEHGKPLESIALIVRGKVQVTREERVLGELGPGELVGSALLLSGGLPEVDAITSESARTVRWDVGTLQRYLDANPETRIALQRHLARDLAGKLQRVGETS